MCIFDRGTSRRNVCTSKTLLASGYLIYDKPFTFLSSSGHLSAHLLANECNWTMDRSTPKRFTALRMLFRNAPLGPCTACTPASSLMPALSLNPSLIPQPQPHPSTPAPVNLPSRPRLFQSLPKSPPHCHHLTATTPLPPPNCHHLQTSLSWSPRLYTTGLKA